MQVARKALPRAVILSAFMVVASLAGPTSAGAVAAPTAARQPDGRVRLLKIAYELFPSESYSHPWLGNDVYNATGTDQRTKGFWYDTTPGWQRWVFGVSIQNDGTSSDRIRVKASGMAVAGYSVRYFDGATDITSTVIAGTFTTPSIGPGGTHLLKVKVTHAADVYDFSDLQRLVSLTSAANPNKVDAVKVVVQHRACTC